MPPIPSKYRLLPILGFLDNRNEEDIKLFETYMRFKNFKGNKSNPNTIRDMIKTIGSLLDLHNDKVLLSVKHTDSGYEVDVIDTTIIKEKGD